MQDLFDALKYYLEAGHAFAYIIALVAGIVTSFTPCVYPVMPITIGYIGANSAGSKSRGFLLSIAYVIGMAVTYAVLGAIASMTGILFGQISTHPLSYFIIGNIVFILGISMLGAFNLKLPSFFTASKIGTNRKSGIIPAFFVGLASGLVVGPCTAPVLAVILAFVATKQNLIYGISMLFTFAIGMGFLFILLGTFTGLLVSMPKAGPWLERIKKIFGWLLVLAGEYFLILAGRLSI